MSSKAAQDMVQDIDISKVTAEDLDSWVSALNTQNLIRARKQLKKKYRLNSSANLNDKASQENSTMDSIETLYEPSPKKEKMSQRVKQGFQNLEKMLNLIRRKTKL